MLRAMDELMPIVAFSERSGLSPNRLRTYAAGRLLVPAASDPTHCAQTSEFGNFGCARFVVTIDRPPTLPNAFLLQLVVVAVNASDGFDQANALLGGFGATSTTVHVQKGPIPGDTITVWVKAIVRDNSSSLPVGTPLPVWAADSTQMLARFGAVGALAPENFAHLAPKRPPGS